MLPTHPYYQPRVDETLHRISPAKYFSVFDMARGFYQIPIAPEDHEKTTVVTPFGKFMFNVMPFGLRNALVIFQRLMDDMLRDCINFAHAYIDNVAIFSMTWTEHLHHLRTVLGLLLEEGLMILPQKTQLASSLVTL